MMQRLDVDQMLEEVDSYTLSEWLAYFSIKEEKREHEKEVDEKNKKAKEAAKRGGF
jgi:hypothetical protein